MAKKSSTVHLPEKVWEEIEEYQNQNGLSSRNDAIEQMFVERRLLLKLNLINNNNNIPRQENVITKDNSLDDGLSGVLSTTYAEMPE